VNGFHPQLTAVSNPVGVNDPPPPSWPSYVHPARSSSSSSNTRTRSSGDNVRLQPSFSSSGSAQTGGASTSAFSGHGPMTPAPTNTTRSSSAANNEGASKSSQINVCTATFVRKLQHHARESDRSRSKMLRKRVRREEKAQRQHLERLRRQQQRLRQQSQGHRPTSTRTSRRASESTATDSSTSSFSFTTMSSSSVSGLNDSGSSDGGSSASSNNKSKRSSMLAPSSSGRSRQDTAINTTRTAATHETHFSELYADVFMASDRPQFMATLGGRLVAYNDEFLSVTGVATSQLRGCMTVHNLIQSSYHPVLNNLFELALRGDSDATSSPFMPSSSGKSCGLVATPPLVVVASRETTALSDDASRERQIAAAMAPPSTISVERSLSPRSDSDLSDGNDAVAKTPGFGVDDGKATSEKEDTPVYMGEEEKVENNIYTALTLPCVSFPRASTLFQMTIVLMNDIDPSRRCFYCIMSPMDQVRQPSAAPVTNTRDSHGLFSAFPLAIHLQQQQQQCGEFSADQSKVVSGDAAKGFIIPPQTSTLGVIRRIDRAELARLL